MRLLTSDSHGELYITRDLADDNTPRYAILSHTWGLDEEEVTFHEIHSEVCRQKVGYKKIEFCRQQAQLDGLEHFWVDTCCIDKRNHVELSKAITCMYRWYQNAAVCYVYLADVVFSERGYNTGTDLRHIDRSWEASFRSSRWFTRGWTLQELLAPREVVFYSREGLRLGTKAELKDLLHEITNIPILALDGKPPSQFSVVERMRWSHGRLTTEKEDQAYCLFGIFNVFIPLIYGEGDRAFSRLTEAINKETNVSSLLKVVDGVTFDAYDQIQQGCHPATRVNLLRSVQAWAQNADGKSIFWLNGAAGTGKSTISWTVASWLSNLSPSASIALGASFFFKRGEGDRASAKLLFPTIASQLAVSVDNFEFLLTQVVKANPQICRKSLGEQFNRLILQPLHHLTSGIGQTTYVMVLDALDECESEDDIRAILQLWSTLPVTSSVRFRLFLTSRPELVIRLGFMKMANEVHQDLILHEVPQLVIEHDIFTFLTDVLAEVRDNHNLMFSNGLVDDMLVNNWPGSQVVRDLTNLATPLFIVAATIHRLIRDSDHPQHCLDSLLRSREGAYLSDMGKVYMLVLQAMTMSIKDKQQMPRMHEDFRMIVGAIITLAEPLPRTALAILLGIKQGDVQIRLRPLHAVLEVPSDGNALIRPLHLSFGEYIASQEIQGTPYWIDTVAMHMCLWKRCLQILSGSMGLRENLCHLGFPGQLLSQVSPTQIDEFLHLEMRYACYYWVHHLQASKYRVCNHDEVHNFLHQHFLHWLEALSCMGRLADAIGFVLTLQSILAVGIGCILQRRGRTDFLQQDSESTLVESFLEDARRFILAFRFIGEKAPLQLYAAVAFTPQNSIVRRVFGQTSPWIQQGPVTPTIWGFELQKLEGHTRWASMLEFCPNGSLLASGSDDNTIRLWDVRTGQEVQTIRHKDTLLAMAFSLNGLVLTSAGRRTVRMWDVLTGQRIHGLDICSQERGSIDISPCGSLVVLTNEQKCGYAISVYNIKKGQEMYRLKADSHSTCRVIFSPSDSIVATIGERTIQLWAVQTGQEIQRLEINNDSDADPDTVIPLSDFLVVTSDFDSRTVRLLDVKTGQKIRSMKGHALTEFAVAFSSSSSLLASGSDDNVVRLWNVKTCQEVLRLEGHTEMVCAVTFSPDNSLLASASLDRTVRLWGVRTGQGVQRSEDCANPRTNSKVCNLAFSPNNLLLASASRETIRIWDVKTGTEVQRLESDTNDPISTIVLSSNGSFLASALYQGIILIWDVKQGGVVQRLTDNGGHVGVIAISPDGLSFASGSSDFIIRMWNVTMGREVWRLTSECCDRRTTILSFSPDGAQIALYNIANHAIRLCNVKTGQVLQTLRAKHTFRLDFSFDGKTLFTDSEYVQLDACNHLIPLPYSIINRRLEVRDDWITCGGKRLLWLPYDYRGDITVVSGGLVAIGRQDGDVAILKIKYPPEDQELGSASEN